jgi:hypothetical protein
MYNLVYVILQKEINLTTNTEEVVRVFSSKSKETAYKFLELSSDTQQYCVYETVLVEDKTEQELFDDWHHTGWANLELTSNKD